MQFNFRYMPSTGCAGRPNMADAINHSGPAAAVAPEIILRYYCYPSNPTGATECRKVTVCDDLEQSDQPQQL